MSSGLAPNYPCRNSAASAKSTTGLVPSTVTTTARESSSSSCRKSSADSRKQCTGSSSSELATPSNGTLKAGPSALPTELSQTTLHHDHHDLPTRRAPGGDGPGGGGGSVPEPASRIAPDGCGPGGCRGRVVVSTERGATRRSPGARRARISARGWEGEDGYSAARYAPCRRTWHT